MSLRSLKTDYKEPSFVGDMKYEVVHNGSTVSFIDRTTYLSDGDYLVASIINDTNDAVNDMAAMYSSWIGSYTSLKVNYIDSTYSGRKEYQMTTSGDYTMLTDVTSYTQVGDSYGAADINATNLLINSLSINCNNGFNSIVSTLRGLGATHTDDLITALREMVTYQTNKGQSEGIAAVKANPSNYRNASNTYNLCTKAAYDAKANSNAAIRQGMTNERNTITTNRNNMQSYSSSFDTMTNNAKTSANKIQSGVSASQATSYANSAMTSINNLNATANSVASQTITAMESSQQRLGRL